MSINLTAVVNHVYGRLIVTKQDGFGYQCVLLEELQVLNYCQELFYPDGLVRLGLSEFFGVKTNWLYDNIF